MHMSLIFNIAHMSFDAIRENKILAKISEFTVIGLYILFFIEIDKLRCILYCSK